MLAQHAFDGCTRFAVAEFRFGLPFELRVGKLDADNGRQALADIVAGKLFVFLKQIELKAVIINRFGQTGAETRQVHTAVQCVYVIDEGVRIFLEAVVVLHTYFDQHTLAACFAIKNFGRQRRFIFIDMLNELPYAAFVPIGTVFRGCFPFVD
jgi:hypothetical protein